jgi:hypothetical protein
MNRGPAAPAQGACDPRFRTLLERVGARPFDESRDCVYGVWRDLTLSYYNAAWAEKVGVGPGQESFLGRPILDVCRPERRSFFARAFTEALQRGEVWERTHATPCAEPERRYLMRLLPLAGDGLLAWHAPVAEGEYGDPHGPLFDQAAYRTPAGLIIQCCHCRRVRAVNSAQPDRWEFIPALLRAEAGTRSGAVCPMCFAYHYGSSFEGPSELRCALDELMDRAPATR